MGPAPRNAPPSHGEPQPRHRPSEPEKESLDPQGVSSCGCRASRESDQTPSVAGGEKRWGGPCELSHAAPRSLALLNSLMAKTVFKSALGEAGGDCVPLWRLIGCPRACRPQGPGDKDPGRPSPRPARPPPASCAAVTRQPPVSLLLGAGWGFGSSRPRSPSPPWPVRSQKARPPPPLLLGFDLLVRVQPPRFLQLPAQREDAPDPPPRSGRQMGQETGSFFQPSPLFILDRLQQ